MVMYDVFYKFRLFVSSKSQTICENSQIEKIEKAAIRRRRQRELSLFKILERGGQRHHQFLYVPPTRIFDDDEKKHHQKFLAK